MSTGIAERRLGVWKLVLPALGVLLLAAPAAFAAPQTLWQRCQGSEEDASCGILRGVAAAPVTAPFPGDVYVADQGRKAIRQFTPWGRVVREWGSEGTGAGQFGGVFGPQGVAVGSAGTVYVVDTFNLRVQKFDSEGHFLLAWGKGVNSGTSGNADLCTNAGPPTDVCGAGGAGTGNGQFSGWGLGSYVAVDTKGTATEADDKVYVGDKGRIQVFDSEGVFQSQVTAGLSATEQVKSLAVDSLGNLYAAIESKNNVRKWNSAGTFQGEPFAVVQPSAIALDGARNLYAIGDSAAEPKIHKFNSLAAEQESFGQEEPPTPKLKGTAGNITGLAAGTACFTNPSKEADLYVANGTPTFLRAYGRGPNSLIASCERPANPPKILAQYATSVGNAEATLGAQINPRFWADTSYRVQYGTEACVGEEEWSKPCVGEKPPLQGIPLEAGEGDFPATAKGIFLDGLAPDTEYVYRFVVQSDGGGPAFGPTNAFRTFPAGVEEEDSCPNAALRSGFGAQLPDCRAYEMVSPIDKEGGDILSFNTPNGRSTAFFQSAADGDGFTYSSYRSFSGAEAAPYTSQYVARRGSDGGTWASEAIVPPLGLPTFTPGGESEYKAFSADLCSGWLIPSFSTEVPLAPGGVEGLPNVYRRDNCGTASGSYEARGYGRLANALLRPELQGLSADGDHVVIRAEDHLAQDAATAVGTQLRCRTTATAKTTSFQWLADGEPIAGKTAATYTTEAAYAGKTVQCRVRLKNDNSGAVEVANPAWVLAPYPATEPPLAPQHGIPAPLSDGALDVGGPGGQTLSCDADAAAWRGSPDEFTYRWYRDGEQIAGQTEGTYSVSAADLAASTSFQCEATAGNAGGQVAVASANLGTVPAPSAPLAPAGRALSGVSSSASSVYDSQGEGGPATVCVLPGTRTQANSCSAGTGTGEIDGRSKAVEHAVSEDGSRIFWTASDNGQGKIYARIDGTQSVPVSEEGEAVSGASESQFWTAAADGSTAIFTAGSLGPSGSVSSTDLYSFDVDGKETTAIAGEVAGVMGASADASVVYFVSAEALAVGGEAGKANLYRYDARAPLGSRYAFVAQLASGDAVAKNNFRPTAVNVEPLYRVARVSPDGETAIFMSTGAPTGYDNIDAASGEADAEVYRYRTGEELQCVSCIPSGGRPVGRLIEHNSNKIWAAAQIPGWESQLYAPRALSQDGSRVFFESFDPLVSRDTNQKQDVYQWESAGTGSCSASAPSYSVANGGCINLLSSGKSPQDSQFLDATPSGDDVFIRTGTSLVASDPGLFDVYDARVGGGQPQPQEAAPCEGDACQSPAAAPTLQTPASAQFEGKGDIPPSRARRCQKGKRSMRHQGKVRCVKRRRHAQHRRREGHHGRAAR